MRLWKGWGPLGWPGRDRALCVRPVEMPGTSGQRDRAQGARGGCQGLAPPATAMTENSDKVPIALVGPDDVEFCSPPVSRARDSQSHCRVSGHAGPGFCTGVRIHCPESGICATESGRLVPKPARVQGSRDPRRR